MTKRSSDTDEEAGTPGLDDAVVAEDAARSDATGEPATAGGDETGEGGAERLSTDAASATPAAPAAESAADIDAAVAAQKDKYLRLYADYENFRKRAVRERQEAESRGMGVLIKGILDALDDLGRFAHLDPATVDAKTVVDGVELVERKLLKSLAGHGLEVVNPVGAPFDPTYHEALTTTPAPSKDADNLVAQVYQVGYVFNGQLLRPARVVVQQWMGGADSGMIS